MNYGMMDDETMIQEVLFTGIVLCAPTTDQPTHHTPTTLPISNRVFQIFLNFLNYSRDYYKYSSSDDTAAWSCGGIWKFPARLLALYNYTVIYDHK